MSQETRGTLTEIREVETIGSGEKMFKKLMYKVVTDETYNNEYWFEVFSQEKVEQFIKYNFVNDKVKVQWNVKCREWEKQVFTTLQSWRCTKDDSQTTAKETVQAEEESDLPF